MISPHLELVTWIRGPSSRWFESFFDHKYMQILKSCFLKWRLMEKKRDLILFPWFLDVYIKPLIPSISTNRKQTMHDVYFCPLKSAGKARLDIPRLPSHRFPCEILGKLCWEIPSRLFVKLMVNCCWFGSVGGLGCEGGVPWKKQQSLKTWGDLRDPNHQTKPTLNP